MIVSGEKENSKKEKGDYRLETELFNPKIS